jgi:diaminopimelate epimerase
MHFVKMHGLGNDYVFVDCFRQPAPQDPSSLARRVSDRHFGIGGDGLILICPSERADARMRIFNADGSEAEMCGNGLRCVAKYLYDSQLVRRARLTIETGRGLLTVELHLRQGQAEQITVDMGEPILEAQRIPTTLPVDRVVDYPLADGAAANLRELGSDFAAQAEEFWQAGIEPRLTCVSMGNPHAIFYCSRVAAVPLERFGPLWERAPIFPRRCNIHLVEVHSPQEATIRTWERGSGSTLACGTGACAVCVAGVLTGRTARRVLAHLPGGDLLLHWDPQDNHVYKTGPAVEVFRGEWLGG